MEDLRSERKVNDTPYACDYWNHLRYVLDSLYFAYVGYIIKSPE